MRNVVVLMVALAGVVVGLMPSRADAGDCERFPGVPYVAARGEVEIERVPDRATLRVEVTQRGKDNASALPALAAKADKLLAAIRGAGVPDNRIKAPGPTAEDVYDVVRDPQGREIVEKRTKVGIDATYSVTVEVDGVDNADGRQRLDKTIAAIARTDGLLRWVSFSISDEREAVARLEREATKAAVAKAKGLIEAAGARPGRVLAVYDSQHQGEGYADLARRAPAPESATVTFALLPGTQRLTGTVEVILESLP